MRLKNRYILTINILKFSETNYCPSRLQLCYLISKTLTLCEGTNSQCKKRDGSVLEEDYQLNFWKKKKLKPNTYIRQMLALSACPSPCGSQASCRSEKTPHDISPLIAIDWVSQVPNSIVLQFENSQVVTYYCQLGFEISFR